MLSAFRKIAPKPGRNINKNVISNYSFEHSIQDTIWPERGRTEDLKQLEKNVFNILAIEEGVVKVRPSKKRTGKDEAFFFSILKIDYKDVKRKKKKVS